VSSLTTTNRLLPTSNCQRTRIKTSGVKLNIFIILIFGSWRYRKSCDRLATQANSASYRQRGGWTSRHISASVIKSKFCEQISDETRRLLCCRGVALQTKSLIQYNTVQYSVWVYKGQIPLRYPAREPCSSQAGSVHELVCDMLATWSQTRCEPVYDQVRAISTCRNSSTCRDSSNLVAGSQTRSQTGSRSR